MWIPTWGLNRRKRNGQENRYKIIIISTIIHIVKPIIARPTSSLWKCEEYNYTKKDTHTQQSSDPPGRLPPPPITTTTPPGPLDTQETKSLKWWNKQNKHKYRRWKKERNNKGEVSPVDCSLPPLRCRCFFFSYYFICLLRGHSQHFFSFLLLLLFVSPRSW